MKPWFGPAVPAACDEVQLARRVERLVTWFPSWSAGLEPAWDKSARKGRLETGAPWLLVLVCAILLSSQPARAQFSPSSGTVVSWGSLVIPYVEPGTRFTAVAAGSGHTVALKDDGTVVAWGDNRFDQTTVPAGLSGVMAIAAGGLHTVAL